MIKREYFSFKVFLLLELFLLGSGQLLKIGPLTIRMILFGVAIVYTIAYALKSQRIDKNIYVLFVFWLFTTIISFLIGIYNSNISMILLDLKPNMFFVMFLYFYFTIKSIDDVIQIKKLLKFSSLTLAVLYLSYLLLIQVNILSFDRVYETLSITKDFFFRGISGIFFYKGFFYLVIGLFFILFDKKIKKSSLMIISIAIILTFTRGFVLDILFVLVLWGIEEVLRNNYKVKYKVFIWVLVAFVLISIVSLFVFIQMNDKINSDSVRIQTIHQVFERINLFSLFFGHGFGVGVPIREYKMEIAYLEIFHKQGLLGLSFWLLLFVHSSSIFYYMSYAKKTFFRPFFYSIVIVYFQSLTNPYINNPIGMSILFISYVVLALGSSINEEELNLIND